MNQKYLTMQTLPPTPISDPNITPFLADIISHINDEHTHDLRTIAEAKLGGLSQQIAVSVEQIYRHGFEMKVCQFATHNAIANTPSQEKPLPVLHRLWVDFDQPIEQLEDLMMAYVKVLERSQRKLGRLPIQTLERKFTFLQGFFVTENMYRMVLTAPNDTVIDQAGYAYLFDIDESLVDNTKDSRPRPHRYYTLRQVTQTTSNAQVWIDVYVHGDNLGSRWATSRKLGDTITTQREFAEHVHHLHDGKALLIADETSLPTVARLLEQWQNPIPPVVMVMTHNATEQAYLSHSTSATPYRLIQINHYDSHDIQGHIQQLLDEQMTFDSVWGGLQAGLVKTLRPWLQQALAMNRQQMVLKVYWR